MMNLQHNLKDEFIIALRHPLSYCSFINLLRVLIFYGGIDKKYILRSFFIIIINFTGIPFRIIEKIKYAKKIQQTQIHPSPVFIIGHWRSGTTYLHNLVAQAPNFGYVSTQLAYASKSFFIFQVFENINKKIVPSKRPMDNVDSSLTSPDEEEYAVANTCPYSIYHAAYFPRGFKKLFHSISHLELNQDTSAIEQWKNAYIEILKKASFISHGKRLVLKNPANTAKIKILLELFPNAKFIHIYRNPYIVYASRKNASKKFSQYFKLQDVSELEEDVNIINSYQNLMKVFLNEKALIAKENFLEIKYEDFLGNELMYLQKIYEQFQLPDFEKSKEYFQVYLNSHSDYQTNKYFFDNETINKVHDAWKFTIDQWQYSPPQ